MSTKRISRRLFLRMAAGAGAVGVMAACAQPTPQVIEKVITAPPEEKVVEKIVKETVPVAQIVKETVIAPSAKIVKVDVNANFFIEPDSFTEAQVWTVHVPEFNKSRSDIQVVLNPVSKAEYTPKVLMQAASGDISDVLWGTGSIPLWSKSNVLAPLDPLAKADNFDLNQYDPQALKMCTYDPQATKWYTGQLWGLSNSYRAGSQMLYWNADVFKAAGVDLPTEKTTYDDILTMAKKIAKPGSDAQSSVFGYLPDCGWSHTVWWETTLLVPLGGEVFDFEGTTAKLNTPETVAAYQWLWDLTWTHKVAPPKEVVDALGSYKGMHMNSQLALYRNGPWGGMHFRLIPPAGEEGHVEASGVGAPVGKNGKRGAFASGEWWGVAAGSKNPDAAWQVLKMVCDNESNKYRALGTLVPPALLATREDPDLLADPLVAMNIKAAANAELPYYAANGRDSEIDTLLKQELSGVIDRGTPKPDQAFFDSLNQKVQAILDAEPL